MPRASSRKRQRAGDANASVGLRPHRQTAAEGLDPVAQPVEPRIGLSSVPDDLEGERFALLLHGDADRCLTGAALERLEPARVDRVRDLWRITRIARHLDGGRDAGANRRRTKRCSEAAKLKRRRVDPLGELSRLVKGLSHVTTHLFQECLRGGGIGVQQGLCELDVDSQRDQLLLRAFVQITFEPLAIGVGGQHEPLPGRAQIRDFGPQLLERVPQLFVTPSLQNDRPPVVGPWSCASSSRRSQGLQAERQAHGIGLTDPLTHPVLVKTLAVSRRWSPFRPESAAYAANRKALFPGPFSFGAYRDRTGDLRLAKPVSGESAEVGSEGESADLAGDSEPPLTEATGSDRRESDRAVGQAWDETGSIDDDPRSQRGPSDDSSTQPEVAGDEPSG